MLLSVYVPLVDKLTLLGGIGVSRHCFFSCPRSCAAPTARHSLLPAGAQKLAEAKRKMIRVGPPALSEVMPGPAGKEYEKEQ